MQIPPQSDRWSLHNLLCGKAQIFSLSGVTTALSSTMTSSVQRLGMQTEWLTRMPPTQLPYAKAMVRMHARTSPPRRHVRHQDIKMLRSSVIEDYCSLALKTDPVLLPPFHSFGYNVLQDEHKNTGRWDEDHRNIKPFKLKKASKII